MEVIMFSNKKEVLSRGIKKLITVAFVMTLVAIMGLGVNCSKASAKITTLTSRTASSSAVKLEPNKRNKKIRKKTREEKKRAKFVKKNLKLMSSIIYCEAGGESYQCQLAVGIVIMNRVRSSIYPNSIKGVVYQRMQFQPARTGVLSRRMREYKAGQTNNAAWKSSIKAAKAVLNGRTHIVYKGKKKNFKSFTCFSLQVAGCRFRMGKTEYK
ncbi:MAG: cell wall hydrolase [Lachnospiraceae bacterium]|nr:cell wall hydrolase [Lachnospiraceae bacterium]